MEENTNLTPEGNTQPRPQTTFRIPEKVPEADTIQLLGIVSLVTGCIGIIPSIMALQKAPKAKAIYYSDPQRYSSESLSKIKTGEACAWVGLVLHGILAVFMVVYIFVVFGLAASGEL